MIEKGNKRYYTTFELVDLIENPETELHKTWKSVYPNYENVVLFEQVSRVVYEGKKVKDISFVEFTKGDKGKKKFYAFLVDDVINYVIKKRGANLKFIDKE